MPGRTLIKTATPGWFIDPAQEGKKVRKRDGDTIVTQQEFDAKASANGDKPEAEVNVLTSGKVVRGKVITITCAERGCTNKRTIKPQDRFQVRRCLEHQKEHRNALRAKRLREKRAEDRKAAKAA